VRASTRLPVRAGAPTGEAALTGAPAARRLHREVATSPGAPLALDVVGVGGSGKSVLLDALAELFAESGARVLRGVPADSEAVDPVTVLLVDDAHLLPESDLRRLAELARAGIVERLVVAHRPWPRTAALAELGGMLAGRRAPLVLGNLDRAGVAGRAALLTDGRPPASLVDAVAATTGGLPSLVERVLVALADAGRLDPARPGAARSDAGRLDPVRPDAVRPDATRSDAARPGVARPGAARLDRARAGAGLPGGLPAGLVEQLFYELDRQPEPLRQLALALAVGAPLDAEVLAPLLEVPALEVAELAEQARSAGLVTEGTEDRPAALRPVWATVVLRRTPAVTRLARRRRLAEVQLDRGGSVLAAARDLLDTGSTGARAARVFETAADEALRTGSPLAGRLIDAAVAAGAPAAELAARGAEAAARAGNLDRALELADQVLADPARFGEADRARAVTVAAAALAQRGLLARSAELYRWLGAQAMGARAVVAVPALIGTGALDEARALLHPARSLGPAAPSAGASAPGPAPFSVVAGAGSGAPTLLAGAESLLAGGVYDTIAGSPTAALSQLARAAALLEPSGGTVLLPDTPAALGALVAAHCGELDVAQSVLDRAVATGLGGRLAAARHRLLQAWVAMSRGATQTARALLTEVDSAVPAAESGPGRLEPRDELVAAALEVGLARRAGDLAALMPAWGRAREAIVRHPVDLYVLQPLGELIVASARLREQAWVRPHLQEAHALLAALGYPPLWSVSLYWSELHAALTAENWAEAQRQAEALEAAAAPGSRYAAAMAVAARSWLAVLHGEVDQAGVESAARGLHAVGLSWEGGKLAGQGAIRTTDRRAMTALLQCARGLQSSAHATDSAAAPAPPPAAPVSPAPSSGPRPRPEPAGPRIEDGPGDAEQSGALSDREVEVAKLVLEGLTYKQIGERLFISAKTVEHHVARMRQRLGSTSRAELMAHLRMIVK
jgi:DNA-binding CsgD family transcriptional regulator